MLIHKIKNQIVNIYPNPARGCATFDYTLEENEDVKIELYDISGKKVANLFNENQNSGVYQERMDLSVQNFKSGVYFTRVKAGTKKSTGKLVVW